MPYPSQTDMSRPLNWLVLVVVTGCLSVAFNNFLISSPWRTIGLAVILPLIIYALLTKTSLKDPYGAFHLSLNVDDRQPSSDMDDDPDSSVTPRKTEWLNMGYWRDTDKFPEACEALALKLVQAGQCHEHSYVLDVGHGSGDSLLLHLNHPSVPRPSRLAGITSLPAHHRRSLERVKESANNGSDSLVPVRLYQGDAVYRHLQAGSDHPLSPRSSNDPHCYDTILALDCAYHFRTREVFLRQSFDRLALGGTVALADICFASPHLSLAKYLIGMVGIIPKENIVSIEQYRSQMENIGYTGVEVEDITDDVFPGFMKFLGRRGWGWSIFARVLGFLHASGARFVIVSGRKL